MFGVIVGMSGGVDSSVTVVLAVKALGKDRVVGLYLPEAETLNLQDTRDAKELAEHLGITFHQVDLSEPLKTLYSAIPIFNPSDRMTNGNLKARTRMATLYYFANKLRLIVLGTSNKSEMSMGYFTKYGDGASDLAPLADLYKTQVYQLASHLNIPDKIINKKPTAGLWPGQLDEVELGVEYRILDLILHGLECHMPNQDIANQLKIPVETVDRICNTQLQSEHKQTRVPIPKAGMRSS
jgi:NAD+ synthase